MGRGPSLERGLAWKDQTLGLGQRKIQDGPSPLRFKEPLTHIKEALPEANRLAHGWLCLTPAYHIPCGCLRAPPVSHSQCLPLSLLCHCKTASSPPAGLSSMGG